MAQPVPAQLPERPRTAQAAPVLEENKKHLRPPVATLVLRGAGFSAVAAENRVEFLAPAEGTTPPTAFSVAAASPEELEIAFDLSKLHALHGFAGPLFARVTVGAVTSKAIQVAHVDPAGPMAWGHLRLPRPLQGRKAATMATLDNKLYIFGGENNEQIFDDLCVLDLETLELRPLAARGPKPYPRGHHSATFIGRRMYVFGGVNNKWFDQATHANRQFDDLWAYDVDDDMWHEVQASGPAPARRDSHVAFELGGQLYVFGGSTLSPRELAPGYHRFSPDEAQWELLSESESLPLCRHPTATRVGGECWLIGGFPSIEDAAGGRWDRIHRFHPENGVEDPWITVEAAYGERPSERDSHASTLLHGKILVAGGWDQDRAMVDNIEFDLSTRLFRRLAPCPTTRVSAAHVGVANYWVNYGGFRFDKRTRLDAETEEESEEVYYEELGDVVKFGYPSVARGLLPPRVVHRGSFDMSVEWDEPIDCNCAQVKEYELYYREEGAGGDWLACKYGRGRCHNQPDLKPWTRYCWRYRARNFVGFSAFSPETVERTAAGPPEPPLFEVEGAVLSINVRLEPTVENGRPVTQFEVQHADYDGWTTLHCGESRTHLHQKVHPRHEQRYRARCGNETGWSDWVESAGHSYPSKPGVPQIWSDTEALTANQMTVLWTLLDDGGAEVEEYALERMTDGVEAFSGMGNLYMEVGLGPVTQLEWRVRARNEVGWGPWSSGCSVTTLPERPDAPELSIRALNPRDFVVTWAPPVDNGAPVTKYTLEFSPDGGASWAVVADGEMLRFVQHCASPALHGRFRCSATNVAGTSDYGTASHQAPPDVPDSVANLWVDGTSITKTEMLVLWNEPACNGSAIRHYRLEQRAEGAFNEWTTLHEAQGKAHLATGLEPGVKYQYRVAAHNGVDWGDWGELCLGRTRPDRPAAPPAIWVEGPSVTGVTMEVRWSEPKCFGEAITCYQLQKRVHGAGSDWQQIYEGENLCALATRLIPEASYVYRARAWNAVGWGPWSQECTGTTSAWEVDFRTGAKEPGSGAEHLDILGRFRSNDKENDSSCRCRLQMFSDTQAWEDVQVVEGVDVRSATEDVDRFFQLMVEHPAGMVRTGGFLHLRMQPVHDESGAFQEKVARLVAEREAAVGGAPGREAEGALEAEPQTDEHPGASPKGKEPQTGKDPGATPNGKEGSGAAEATFLPFSMRGRSASTSNRSLRQPDQEMSPTASEYGDHYGLAAQNEALKQRVRDLEVALAQAQEALTSSQSHVDSIKMNLSL